MIVTDSDTDTDIDRYSYFSHASHKFRHIMGHFRLKLARIHQCHFVIKISLSLMIDIISHVSSRFNSPHLKYSERAAKMILWPLKWVFSTTSVMSAYSSLSTSSPKFSDSATMWSTIPTGVGDRRWWWSHILTVDVVMIANTCSIQFSLHLGPGKV